MELQPKTDAERRKVIRAAKGVYTFINLGHGDEYIAKITKRDAMEIVSLMKGRNMEFDRNEDGDVYIVTHRGGLFDVEIPNGEYHKYQY